MLLLPAIAHAQDHAYATSRVALYGGTAWDLGTTEVILKAGGRELNPVLGQNPYRRISVAIGATVATDLATRWFKKNGHPKLAAVINFAFGAAHIGAGIHNVRGIENDWRR
jgi:hypothetical protein